MPFIPKPEFPNVPKLPGVPQLRRSLNFPANPGPLVGVGLAVGSLWRALFTKNRWGIFRQQKVEPNAEGIETVTTVAELTPVVDCDSVLDFGFRNEVDVPDYPIQDGSFASYNRVNLPYEASVRLSKGGSEEARRKFLEQINALMTTTELFQIITPERTYTNVNCTRFEMIRRGAGGAFFLTEVDLYFREIRAVTAQYSNTSTATQDARNPSAQPVDNRGTVAGERPTSPPALDGVVNE